MHHKSILLFCTLLVTACGGGSDGVSTSTGTTTGGGTVNNGGGGGNSGSGNGSGNQPSGAVLLFEDDFESGNLSKSANGFRWTDSTRDIVVSSATARNGTYSLQFTYPAVADGEDGMSEQRFYLGGNYRDVTVEYDLLIPANYYHRTQSGAANNKGFLYLWANTYGDPRPLVATNFWPDGSGQSIGSIYTRPNDLGHYMEFTAPAIASSDAGKWLHIVVRYAYASAANNDGIAQIWKTPEGGTQVQIVNKTNGPWYHADGTGFDNGYLLGWSNSGFAQETRLYIDNFKVWGVR